MDKVWWKRFVFALLGLGLYLLDTGSDTWVGHQLIQNCHFGFGAAVICLVYVLPGVFGAIIFSSGGETPGVFGAIIFSSGGETIVEQIIIFLVGFTFFVPISAIFLLMNLIKLDDTALELAKG